MCVTVCVCVCVHVCVCDSAVWKEEPCVCVCMCVSLSCVQLFAQLYPAHQAPLSGILQVRILEWLAIPSSRRSS